jgi:DNA-binding XRE family transcriptional regulator
MQARTVITRHEQFRRQAGYTVTGLARKIGVSHTYVSRIEGQDVSASVRYRKTVARLFGVRQALLFDKDGRAS